MKTETEIRAEIERRRRLFVRGVEPFLHGVVLLLA